MIYSPDSVLFISFLIMSDQHNKSALVDLTPPSFNLHIDPRLQVREITFTFRDLPGAIDPQRWYGGGGNWYGPCQS